jgi:hypothetical protein
MRSSGCSLIPYRWRTMPKDEKDQQAEQTPTGYTVPVPKRNEFFGNLKKAAKPEDRPDRRDDPPASDAGD